MRTGRPPHAVNRAKNGAARLLPLLLGCAAGACSGGVVSGTAYDRPLFTINGFVRPAGELTPGTAYILSLLWTDPLQEWPDVPMVAPAVDGALIFPPAGPTPVDSGDTTDGGPGPDGT